MIVYFQRPIQAEVGKASRMLFRNTCPLNRIAEWQDVWKAERNAIMRVERHPFVSEHRAQNPATVGYERQEVMIGHPLERLVRLLDNHQFAFEGFAEAFNR